jgi:hypothetical protein
MMVLYWLFSVWGVFTIVVSLVIAVSFGWYISRGSGGAHRR